MLKVCMAGATGWTGSAIAEAVTEAEDMALVSCVARRAAGQELHGAPCFATLDEALAGPDFDVLIDYTAPEAIMGHTLAAVAAGKHVVVGTSGPTAAEYLDWFEVIDYAKPGKTDAPTGTARELAERMGAVKRPAFEVDLASVTGEPGLRGGMVNGVQVHSLRLPSYSATVTSTFAHGNSRLTITHDAGKDPTIYNDGTLLAARKVMEIVGLVRGLDTLL